MFMRVTAIAAMGFVLILGACSGESSEGRNRTSRKAEQKTERGAQKQQPGRQARQGQPAGQENARPPLPSGDDEVSEAVRAGELRGHVEFLASDALRGRFLGTDGVARAEEYIAARFRDSGLVPLAGESDYFTEFTLYEHGFDPKRTSLSLEGAGSTANDPASGGGTVPGRGTFEENFKPFWFSEEATVSEREVVFAGYGISAPEHDYDDYAGLDVEDKIVLVLRHEPNEEDPDSVFNGSEWSEHAYFTTKAETAAEHGAAGMILVTDPLHHEGAEDFRILRNFSLESDRQSRGGRRPEAPDPNLPAVHASQALVERAAQTWPESLEEIQRKLDTGTSVASLDLPPLRGSMAVHRRNTASEIEARNVVATLPSRSDEADRDDDDGEGGHARWILIGAHHDHLGTFSGPGDTILNGADDNASGTAAVIELAERMAQAGTDAEDYRIAFATFAAEEVGLFGSRWLAENSSLSADKVALMVTADMVGRNPDQDVAVYGSNELGPLFDGSGGSNGSEVKAGGLDHRFHGEDLDGMSDFYPYAEGGSKYLFFTTGLHEDYHGVDDEASRIAYSRLAEITVWMGDLVQAWIRGDARGSTPVALGDAEVMHSAPRALTLPMP
jgi:hypothetical protein